MKLKDPLLLRQLCFIDGAWAAADDATTLNVHNPATNEKLGVYLKDLFGVNELDGTSVSSRPPYPTPLR